MGLQTFFKTHYNTHVRILTDNTTAIAVLNHMGTSHSDPCNRLGKEIWEWCIDRNIWLSAAHIPGFTISRLISNRDEPTITRNGWLIGPT